jgi:undecaprenyl-diphosphatase
MVLVVLGVVAALGLVFGDITEDVLDGGGALRFDKPVMRLVLRHRTPLLTTAFRGLTLFGGVAELALLVVVLGGIWLVVARSWRPMAALAAALVGSSLITHAIKQAVARPRPPVAYRVVSIGGESFPSGHATQAAAVWCVVVLLAVGLSRRWWHRALALGAGMAIVLGVAMSRVYLGVHWPSDVAGGSALGALWAIAVSVVLLRPLPVWPSRSGRASRSGRSGRDQAPS